MAEQNPAEEGATSTKKKPARTKPSTPVPPENIGNEVASEESRIYKQYAFVDYNPDDLVGRKGLRIYKSMMRDEQVKACVNVKKLARLSTKWEIKPGDEKNEKSKEMAEFVEYVLRNIKTSVGPEINKNEPSSMSTRTVTWAAGSFNNVLMRIMSAIEYGFSLTEKVWAYYEDGPYKGMLGLAALKTKEPFGYDFETDKFSNLVGLIQPGSIYGQGGKGRAPADDAKASEKKSLDPTKFVIFTHNQDFGNWYGTSDLRAAYRPWWSKDMIIKWWNIYLERFGMPTTVIKTPSKPKPKREVLDSIDDILQNLQAKGGFRIPDTFTAEFLEAKRAGEAGYKTAVDAQNVAIARAMLIPNKLGFGEDENGSYALGKKHFDLFLFVLESLGNDLSENVVDEQIIKPLIAMNFGAVDEELMPYFSWESLLGVDQEPRANVLKALKEGGFVDPREDWVRDYMDLPARDIKKYPHTTPEGEAIQPVLPGQGGGNDPNDPEDRHDDKDGPNGKPGGKFKACTHGKHAHFTEGLKLSRKPNRFERKVNFAAMAKNVDAMTNGLTEALRIEMEDIRKDFMKKVQKIFDAGETKAVNDLQLFGMKAFRDTLRDYLVKTHLDTKLSQLEELGQTEDFEVEVQRRFSSIFTDQSIPFEPWEPVPPTEAIDLFNRKVLARVSANGDKKVLIPLGRAAEMKYYDARAFYVSGVEERYILNKTKGILLTGIEKGWSNRRMMEEMNNVFDQYLARGGVIDGAVNTPARLETIVRTNLTEAYNRGRQSMIEHPMLKESIPYVQWSSIMDERTTDYCSNMDTKVFRQGEIEEPPAHFNCRSLIVPITKTEAEDDPSAIQVSTQAELERIVPRAEGFQINTAYDPKPWTWLTGLSFCVYTSCTEPAPRLVTETPVIKTYQCTKCNQQMRISKAGDIYLHDAGTEKWTRVSKGIWPNYFRDGHTHHGG